MAKGRPLKEQPGLETELNCKEEWGGKERKRETKRGEENGRGGEGRTFKRTDSERERGRNPPDKPLGTLARILYSGSPGQAPSHLYMV